jgi:type II secretory pathway component PulF
MEPITICLLAGIVCIILLAVYLPMFGIYGDFNATL